MSDPVLSAELLLLLLVANGAPIIARNLLQGRFDRPLDGGRSAPDGYRWLGSAKTWRGLIVSIGATLLVAWLLGVELAVAAKLSALAMIGDLISSFAKRRMGLPSSSRASGLDQLPEAALPLLAVRDELGLAWGDMVVVVVLFVVLEILLSRGLYRLRIRRRPY